MTVVQTFPVINITKSPYLKAKGVKINISDGRSILEAYCNLKNSLFQFYSGSYVLELVFKG